MAQGWCNKCYERVVRLWQYHNSGAELSAVIVCPSTTNCEFNNDAKIRGLDDFKIQYYKYIYNTITTAGFGLKLGQLIAAVEATAAMKNIFRQQPRFSKKAAQQ